MTTRRQRSDRRLRAPLRSPGRPGVARRAERMRFWAAIAAGRTSEDAGRDAGVPPVVGSRWFREAGGMPPTHLAPSAALPSARCFSFVEREEIALLRVQGRGVRAIARCVGRAPSTISRELRRNAATRHGGFEYRTLSRAVACRSLCAPAQGIEAGEQRGAASLRRRPIGGPDRAGRWHRGARPAPGRAPALDEAPVGPAPAPAVGASLERPAQISARLRIDFPGDEAMRISHEAIHQSLYVQGRGGLRRELSACLRSGRARAASPAPAPADGASPPFRPRS